MPLFDTRFTPTTTVYPQFLGNAPLSPQFTLSCSQTVCFLVASLGIIEICKMKVDIIKLFSSLIIVIDKAAITFSEAGTGQESSVSKKLLAGYRILDKAEIHTHSATMKLDQFISEQQVGMRVNYIHSVGIDLSKLELWFTQLEVLLKNDNLSEREFLGFGLVESFVTPVSDSKISEEMDTLRKKLQAVRSPSPKLFPSIDTAEMAQSEIEALLVAIRATKENLFSFVIHRIPSGTKFTLDELMLYFQPQDEIPEESIQKIFGQVKVSIKYALLPCIGSVRGVCAVTDEFTTLPTLQMWLQECNQMSGNWTSEFWAIHRNCTGNSDDNYVLTCRCIFQGLTSLFSDVVDLFSKMLSAEFDEIVGDHSELRILKHNLAILAHIGEGDFSDLLPLLIAQGACYR